MAQGWLIRLTSIWLLASIVWVEKKLLKLQRTESYGAGAILSYKEVIDDGRAGKRQESDDTQLLRYQGDCCTIRPRVSRGFGLVEMGTIFG